MSSKSTHMEMAMMEMMGGDQDEPRALSILEHVQGSVCTVRRAWKKRNPACN